MTEEEKIICKEFLNDADTTHSCNEYKLLMALLEREPRKGKWISKPHVYGVTYCSECDFELKIDDTDYCPNCGAKMEKRFEEVEESEDKE